MDDNVIPFPVKSEYTYGEVDPRGVLQGITDADLQTVVVMGYDQNGEEYFASSTSNGPTILWLMEKLKLKVLLASEDDEEDYGR